MTDEGLDIIEFDPLVALALAEGAASDRGEPRPDVKQRLMEGVLAGPVPEGFSFNWASDDRWHPHPLPGIRVKILAKSRASGYVTAIFDVAPGTRFPAHHHGMDEECYVISGSLFTCGRKLGPGDFVHADAGTDHPELWTEEGCRVLLVVAPEDYFPDPG